jgi:hypothetical protein
LEAIMTRLSLVVLLAALVLAGPLARAQDQPAPAAEPPAVVPPPAATPSPPAAVPPPVAPAPPPTAAVPPASTEDNTRFSFHRVGDSFVRLDGRTGNVSLCRHGAGGWSCQAVPDQRNALENEIGRLQSENATLKRQMLARGLELPGGTTALPPVAKAPETKSPEARSADRTPPRVQLPDDAELNRMFAFMEKVWRRMVEMMAALQRDIQRKN